LDADRRRQLRRGHDSADRTRLRGREDGAAEAFDERDHRDRGERDGVEQDQRREAAERGETHRVGRDHQPLPAAPVGCHSGGKREERARQVPRERDEARFRR